jgi:hypothetical protein
MTPLKLGLGMIGAALLGGAVSATVVLAVKGSDKKITQPTAETSPNHELAALQARVKALETNQSNARVIPSLQRLVAQGAGGASAGSQAPAQPLAPVVDDPVFEAAVRDVMDRAQEEREADRELEREERRKRMAQRWSDELASQLALSDAQRPKVQAIVQEFFDQLRAMREADAGTIGREERRQRMRDLREQGERKLNEVLDRSQQEKYKQLGNEQRLGGRMAGPQRGGGGRN